MIPYHAGINTCQTTGMVLFKWLNCIWLLIDNIIVPVIVFLIFKSIAELGAANLELKPQIDKLSLKI